MSDTPKTDELAKREFIPDGVWIRHARELERENAALRAETEEAQCVVIGARLEARELKHENDELWERLGRAAVDEGKLRRENTRLLQVILNARKEAQPCQCTNGVIRSVGRDNDEVIEDCPDCSGSKESQP